MESDTDPLPEPFHSFYFISTRTERENTRLPYFLKENMVNHKKMVHPPDRF